MAQPSISTLKELRLIRVVDASQPQGFRYIATTVFDLQTGVENVAAEQVRTVDPLPRSEAKHADALFDAVLKTIAGEMGVKVIKPPAPKKTKTARKAKTKTTGVTNGEK